MTMFHPFLVKALQRFFLVTTLQVYYAELHAVILMQILRLYFSGRF
jgi:hypothetical protein